MRYFDCKGQLIGADTICFGLFVLGLMVFLAIKHWPDSLIVVAAVATMLGCALIILRVAEAMRKRIGVLRAERDRLRAYLTEEKEC